MGTSVSLCRRAALPDSGVGPVVGTPAPLPLSRGLPSSTCQLNVSAIGGNGGIEGVFWEHLRR